MDLFSSLDEPTNSRKILHAADIHLDSPLQKLDRYENAPADRIRKASRLALENMTQLAIEQEVDLVVIAGDLYDGDWTDQNTGLAFVQQAGRLIQAGIPLLVIRGNHDAANLMTNALPLPKNPDGSDIFLSHEEAESRFFDDLGIVVHGMSFRSRAEKRNLAAKYASPTSGMFNLGLLHTGVEGTSEHGNYAPCTPAQLTEKGYDYWALGHIHVRQNLGVEGGPPIVFSGNIQGRHIKEQGAKGCVIIKVDAKNHCTHEFFPLDVLRWEQQTLNVSEFSDRDEIYDAYQSWLTDQLDQCEGRLLISRVRLTGESDLHASLHQTHASLISDLQAISVAHGAGQVWLEDVKVRTSTPHTTAAKGGLGGASQADLEGPLQSLSHVLESLRADDDLADKLQSQLESLHKKLPKELLGDQGDAAFPYDDGQWVDAIVESAAADVLARLSGTNADHSPNQDQSIDRRPSTGSSSTRGNKS